MAPIVEAGHVPVISAMGNLPIVKDLVVDMAPFWGKIRAVKPWLDPGYDEIQEKERDRLAAADERDREGVALHHVRLLRQRVQLDGGRPRLPRAGRAGQGLPLRRRPARGHRSSGSSSSTASTGSGTAPAATSATSAARRASIPRDAIAKLGAESIKEGIEHDMGAKHAKWFVHLREDDRLAARDRARAEDAGHHHGDQADGLRARARQEGQGAARRSRRTSPTRSTRRAGSTTSSAQGRRGAPGTSRASARSPASSTARSRRARQPEITRREPPPAGD